MYNSFCKRTYIEWFNYRRHHISEYLYYPKDIQVMEWQVFIQCCMYWRALCFRKKTKSGGQVYIQGYVYNSFCKNLYGIIIGNIIFQMSASPAKNKISHQTNVLKKFKKNAPSAEKGSFHPQNRSILVLQCFFFSLIIFGLFYRNENIF